MNFWKRFLDKQFRKKLLIVGGSIAGVYLILAVVLTVVLVAREDASRPQSLQQNTTPVMVLSHDSFDNDEIIALPEPITTDDDDGGFLSPPIRTNFLFLGLDHNLLTDAIMVGAFYRDTGDIRLMSIPRDTYTRIPEHRLTRMRADGLRPPTVLRINAMRAFGGRVHGIYYLKEQLGEMLGVQFHYYVEVELDAFIRIVDAIGGVEMYIPRQLFYQDPEQNLFINIPAGMQHLNGSMAEGVVRFRSFPTGDIMRNTMQMEFMNQLIRQTLTREAIMNNPMALLNIIINDVETNVGLDAVRYLPYITNITAESIHTFTMPGHPQTINGASYFIPNASELHDVVRQVFYYAPGEDDDDDATEYEEATDSVTDDDN